MSDLEIALSEARQAVLTAPDRQTLIEAYRYWYDLKNGNIKIEQSKSTDDSGFSSGWLDTLEKYYG